MALLDDLMDIEKQFWTKGADFYVKNVDRRCLLAFGRMAGSMSNEEVAATTQQGQRWDEPHVEVKGLIEPTPDFAVLTYEANTKRADGQPYAAVVSSGYVKRNGSWKLAFHQHTPV